MPWTDVVFLKAMPKVTAMTNKTGPQMTLPDFEYLLDVYGADRTRWPLSARAGTVALLAADAAARRLLAEAVALEDVLSNSPEPDAAATAALADRIMASTRRAPRLVASTDKVARPAQPVRSSGASMGTADRDLWRGAALMAASLIIGIFVGQTQFGAGAVPAIEALTGVALPGSGERLAVADLLIEATDVD